METMTITVRAFGITKEILGGREVAIEISGKTVGDLRNKLLDSHPKLIGLRSMMIAVNNQYAEDSEILSGSEEIALIPPVSGG